MWPYLINNKYIVGIAVPIILLFTGAFTKKLIRGTKLKRSDFFLGVEFALAAMTSALIYCCELGRELTHKHDDNLSNHLSAGVAFLAITFVLLLVILSTHQDWEKPGADRRKQFFYLGIISNSMGSILICAFILIIKGFN
jgi:hypothetical protein